MPRSWHEQKSDSRRWHARWAEQVHRADPDERGRSHCSARRQRLQRKQYFASGISASESSVDAAAKWTCAFFSTFEFCSAAASCPENPGKSSRFEKSKKISSMILILFQRSFSSLNLWTSRQPQFHLLLNRSPILSEKSSSSKILEIMIFSRITSSPKKNHSIQMYVLNINSKIKQHSVGITLHTREDSRWTSQKADRLGKSAAFRSPDIPQRPH